MEEIAKLKLELIQWVLKLDNEAVLELYDEYLSREEDKINLYKEQAAYEETNPYEHDSRYPITQRSEPPSPA